MNTRKVWIVQAGFCFAVLSGCLLAYLEKQNELTELRLYVPKLTAEIHGIQEGNTQLLYQIQEFESPEQLIKMAASGSFPHLKHPLEKEVLVIQEGNALQSLQKTPNHTLAVGTK